ncbi:hypothetical protein H6800_02015 [Candidatus Nomurabacteria bacterium]|nr:hypothetical protein [Candidatus Nomurabacteria bacterium]
MQLVNTNFFKSVRLRYRVAGFFVLLILLASSFASFLIFSPAHAATGINEKFNFQGRLLDSTGGVVPDGSYNMRFKLYQDGDGVLGGGDETLKWTETRQNSASQGVTVKNGYFSVYLGSVTAFGSSVDWNQDTLWLSIDIGGTSTGGSPTYDGEMSPFKSLGASPFALNTKYLGGLSSTNFLQIAQGVQVDASTSSSLFLNKTGASGNILELQKDGVDVLSVGNTGALVFQNTVDSNTGFTVYDADGGTPVFNIDTTNERVGIGTANPTNTLSVNGTTDIQGKASIGSGATVNGGLTGLDSLFGSTSHVSTLGVYETNTTSGSTLVTYDGLLVNNILNPSSTATYGQANGLNGFLTVAPGNAQDLTSSGGIN